MNEQVEVWFTRDNDDELSFFIAPPEWDAEKGYWNGARFITIHSEGSLLGEGIERGVCVYAILMRADRAAELEAELALCKRMVKIAAYHSSMLNRRAEDSVEQSVEHYIRVWREEACEESGDEIPN